MGAPGIKSKVEDGEVTRLSHLKNFQGFGAGIASGVTKMVVGHPFDTIKVRMQTEGGKGRFKGPLHCFKDTITKEGPLALYKGATPPLVGWAIIDSFQAGTYTFCKEQLMAHYQLKDNQGYLIHAGSGLVGGWVSGLVSNPIEQVKARLQVQYDSKNRAFKGPIDCSLQIIRKFGLIKGLWTGLPSTLLFRSHFAILWPSYHFTTARLNSYNNEALNPFIPFLSGGIAATLFWCVAFPSDVIKNRMMSQPIDQVKKYKTVRECFKYILMHEGWKGFYRGFVPAILRSFPTNGAALMMYEFVMRYQI